MGADALPDALPGQADPGRLLREARLRRRVTQKRLAIRAGTTQSAISRIERGEVSPTISTLASLLEALGEELVLESRRLDWGHDRDLLRRNLAMTPDQRVRRMKSHSDFVKGNRGAARRGRR